MFIIFRSAFHAVKLFTSVFASIEIAKVGRSIASLTAAFDIVLKIP
jgi:hypothetical protein